MGKGPGVVFQDPALLPWLNAMVENVLLPLESEGRLGAAGFKVRDALANSTSQILLNLDHDNCRAGCNRA